MGEVIEENEHTEVGGSFWLLWVFVNAVGFALGLAVARNVFFFVLIWLVSAEDPMNFAIGGGILGAVLGIFLGIAQWVVLRKQAGFGTSVSYRLSDRLLDALNVIWKWLGLRRKRPFTNEKGEPVYLSEAITNIPEAVTNTADEVSTIFGIIARWVRASTVGLAVGGAVVGVAIAAGSFAVNEEVTVAVFSGVLGASIGLAQWYVLRRIFSEAGWWLLVSIVGGVAAVVIGRYVSAAGVMLGVVPGAIYGAITGSAMVWLLGEIRSEA